MAKLLLKNPKNNATLVLLKEEQENEVNGDGFLPPPVSARLSKADPSK